MSGTIRLHDTMAREKRDFVPADPKRITMYVCGPTVYGRAHIGNARPAVVFDLLRRVLEREFPNHRVLYARNVTDVDDKIIAAAEEEGVGYRRITEKYYQHYIDDMGALGVRLPDFQPRATAFVPRMIDMIGRLIEKGHAYEAEGHVLFSVPSDPKYGALSGRDREAMIAGARVEVAPYKRDPTDFVLWKPAGKSAEQVALSFDSPWGRGRPGWHIECSAMIEAFGDSRGDTETIDIHGGGLDLIFPHHENEIAQSRCAHNDAPLARFWVHNGFVDMGSDKMSKSLGNVITPEELLKRHKGEVLRLALLSAHYRQPLPWTEELLKQSKARLDRWYRALEPIWDEFQSVNLDPAEHDDIAHALSDDINTPEALTRMDYHFVGLTLSRPGILIKNAGEEVSPQESRIHHLAQIRAGAALLGLITETPESWFRGDGNDRIDGLISERDAAKKARDFATADRIRDELKAEGVLLEDGPEGTTWRRA